MMQHSFWTDLRLQRRMMSYLLISREKKMSRSVFFTQVCDTVILVYLPFGKRKLLHILFLEPAY